MVFNMLGVAVHVCYVSLVNGLSLCYHHFEFLLTYYIVEAVDFID